MHNAYIYNFQLNDLFYHRRNIFFGCYHSCHCRCFDCRTVCCCQLDIRLVDLGCLGTFVDDWADLLRCCTCFPTTRLLRLNCSGNGSENFRCVDYCGDNPTRDFYRTMNTADSNTRHYRHCYL